MSMDIRIKVICARATDPSQLGSWNSVVSCQPPYRDADRPAAEISHHCEQRGRV
jgi:hypothetical protein